MCHFSLHELFVFLEIDVINITRTFSVVQILENVYGSLLEGAVAVLSARHGRERRILTITSHSHASLSLYHYVTAASLHTAPRYRVVCPPAPGPRSYTNPPPRRHVLPGQSASGSSPNHRPLCCCAADLADVRGGSERSAGSTGGVRHSHSLDIATLPPRDHTFEQ